MQEAFQEIQPKINQKKTLLKFYKVKQKKRKFNPRILLKDNVTEDSI